MRCAELALGLLGEARTTRSRALTVLVDMNRQLADASKSISDLTLDDPAELADRDQVLGAVQSAELAVLTWRDCLQTSVSCASATDRLRRADDLLGAAQAKLRAEQ